MTIPEFLEVLRVKSHGVEWTAMQALSFSPERFGIGTKLINGTLPSLQQCPIAFVAHCNTINAIAIGVQELHLSLTDAVRLVEASDEAPHHDATLRLQLLDAVGLTERSI